MLRRVLPADVDWVASASVLCPRTQKWNLGGRSPNPDLIRRLLWDRVLVQAVVEVDRSPLSLLQVHDSDLQNGHAKLSVLRSSGDTSDGEVLRSDTGSFLRDLVRDFPLRKLYVEVTQEMEKEVLDHLPVQVKNEGRLREHERLGPGNYSDLCIYVLYDDDIRSLGE